MIRKRSRRLVPALAPLLIVLFHAPLSGQEQLKVSDLAPRALAVGMTTTISFVTKRPSGDLSLELSPSAGISVAEIRPLVTEGLRREFKAWEANIKVDEAAALGNRVLTVSTPGQRSEPQKIEVVGDAPRVSELVVTTKACGAGYLGLGPGGTEIDYNFIVLGKSVDVKSIKMSGFGKARSGGLKVVEEAPFGGGIQFLGQAYKTEPTPDGGTKVYCRSCTRVRWGEPWTLGVSVEDEHGHQSNRLCWTNLGAGRP